MYQLDKRTHHHRLLRNGLVIIVLAAVGFFGYRLMHATTPPHGTIHNAPPLSTAYDTGSSATMHVDKPLFTMNLPKGWKQVAVSTSGLNLPTYEFKSPAAQAQDLAVYIDATPTTLAVNRVVVVTPQGAGMSYETVSDNCSNFTNPTATETARGIAQGKWQGTAFLCDIGNFERDVVGLASTSGTNIVTLTGPTVGQHQVFMAYTDNNVNPDFGTLYSILTSFKLK